MFDTSLAAFTEGMVQLRRTLADADPFASAPQPDEFTTALRAVAASFTAAPEAERPRYLLRALDEAIGALEAAALLAEALLGLEAMSTGAENEQGERDALRTAYLRFRESLPAYQALYHVRNALAERERIEGQALPNDARGAQEPGQSTP
jgi:hypothetical protein